MKERPIIMSVESVRAILAGRKTQTRRVLNPQPSVDGFWHHNGFYGDTRGSLLTEWIGIEHYGTQSTQSVVFRGKTIRGYG